MTSSAIEQALLAWLLGEDGAEKLVALFSVNERRASGSLSDPGTWSLYDSPLLMSEVSVVTPP